MTSPEAFEYGDPQISKDEYAEFLEEAKEQDVLRLGTRCAVTVVAKDRVGLVRDVTSAIEQQVEVEGASQATLGGITALSLIVSCQRHGHVDFDRMRADLSAVEGVDDEHVFIAGLRGQRSAIPDGYSRWYVYGTAPDQVGVLHSLTEALGRRGAWLTRTLSLVLDNERCDIELAAALPPATPVAGLVSELEARYTHFGGRLMSFSRYRPPVERSLSWLLANQADFKGCQFLSVVGRAKPNLVATVAGGLAAARINVSGSSMEVIRGHTVAIFAIGGAGSETAIAQAMESAVESFGIQYSLCDAPNQTFRQEDVRFCFLSLMAMRQRGVLSAASRALATQGTNIERLRADTTESDDFLVIDAVVGLPPERSVEEVGRALEDEGVEWLLPPSPVEVPLAPAIDLVR